MADNDLDALITRLKELTAGTMLTVLIPKGQITTVAGLLLQENETFHIPSALFSAPALDGPVTPPAVTTATATLNLRAEPERGAALVGQVQAGATVTVTGAAVGEYAPVTLAGWVLRSGVG